MKLNIENKILIPLVFLFFISQVVTLASSFINDYNLIIKNQYRTMDEAVHRLERSLDYDLKYGKVEIDDRAGILDGIENMMMDTVIIKSNGETLLNKGNNQVDIQKLDTIGMNGNITHFQSDDYLFSYYYYAELGWSVTILADKQVLLSYFYESYKYNILIAIIFLTLSLQITVFVASNITNPIKKMVKFCSNIGDGTGERVILNRQDEIGQLNIAFNLMLDQLNMSMEELMKVKNYNQNIINGIENGIMTYNNKGEIISSNPYADELLNQYSEFYNNGRSLIEVIESLVSQTTIVESGVYEQIEFVSETANENYFLDCYVSAMHDNVKGIQGYICSFNDVTKRKKIENHMQRIDRLATAGRLASGVAHEIRNPLTGMRTSMQVLNKRLGLTSEDKNSQIINRTIKEIDRINRLISDLLGYSKPKVHMPEDINVHKQINSVLSLLESDIDQKGIAVIQENNPPNLSFHLDPNHFHQIVLNIIKNAMDAVQSGGVITISTKQLEDSHLGELRIKDNGVGMTESDLEKVFDPFFTLKNDGTGLGMSVVHELVHQNESTINLESKLGEGTTVTFNFKLGGMHNE